MTGMSIFLKYITAYTQPKNWSVMLSLATHTQGTARATMITMFTNTFFITFIILRNAAHLKRCIAICRSVRWHSLCLLVSYPQR